MDNIEQQVEEFLTHISIEKNYSQATVNTYRIALSIFTQFLLEKNILITDKKCIMLFIQHLNQRNNADVTIAHRLGALKSFFHYLVNKNIISKKKLPSIEKYKTTKKILPIPSDDEVNRFTDTIEQEYRQVKEKMKDLDKVNERIKAKYFSLFRDLTFFTLLIATGLRISEALNIKIEDIDWNHSTIKILGKGSKERLIFFGVDRLISLFTELIKIRVELGIENSHLFISYRDRLVLTPRYFQQVMKEFLDKTPASSKYTPHTLRHYYATSSIEKGANIKAIAILLGHAYAATTIEMYYHISEKMLREVFEATNPFSKIALSVKEMMSKRYEVLVNL